jgi:hypothetical protein
MSTVAPMVNGLAPRPSFNETAEYEKILKLRDEVFAGLHPRLSVPAHAAQATSTQTPQLTSQGANVLPFTANTAQKLGLQGPSAPQPSPATFSNSASTSEFNPVLLTKSDDLVRAETALKRQRLEKTLKEQFEQKRMDTRKRPAPAEAKPDFDLPALLLKALNAKSSTEPKDGGDASDSFDENSFYSSRAPDSTPERGAQSPSPNQEDGTTNGGPSSARVQSAVMGAPLEADADDEYSPRLGRRESPAYSPAMDPDDEEEEGEYSPPEVVEDDAAMQDAGYQNNQDYRDPRTRTLRRYSENEDPARGGPSDGNIRIVRNHITSPVAPQPSRVSPLAVAKGPPFQQNARSRRQRSPDGMHPKKKRRLEKQQRKMRRQGGNSPDVKEENVSPPPFHEVQPLGAGRLRPSNQHQPILIDDGPREPQYASNIIERPMASPARSTIRYAEPAMPMSEPRPGSRAVMRPMRDTQDLRRVASMHNVRMEAAGDFDAYVTPTRSRVASYREGSPMVRQPVHDEMYDQQPLQEVRVSRTPAPIYRETYPEETHVRYEPMPQPEITERIVVGADGRRYREIIERRAPTLPRPSSVRPTDAGSVYERPTRAGSVMMETPPERRYIQQGMPPPPPLYRQDSRASLAPVARDVYGQPVSHAASILEDRGHSRQPMYADSGVEYRAPIRMGSVRPGPQYEDMQPRETLIRASSVRPSVREGTMLLDQPRREYMPVEQPRYRTVDRPGERYFDEQGREIIMQARY